MNASPSFSDLKIETIQMLASLQDAAILDKVHSILMNAAIPEDWYERLSDQDKEEIRQSRIDMEAGNVVQHEELMERMRSWVRK